MTSLQILHAGFDLGFPVRCYGHVAAFDFQLNGSSLLRSGVPSSEEMASKRCADDTPFFPIAIDWLDRLCKCLNSLCCPVRGNGIDVMPFTTVVTCPLGLNATGDGRRSSRRGQEQGAEK